MKEEQFEIINKQLAEDIKQSGIIYEILLKIMEELVNINKKLASSEKEQSEIKSRIINLEEIQEVLRKELNTYDLNQIKWQLKIEKELMKLDDFI